MRDRSLGALWPVDKRLFMLRQAQHERRRYCESEQFQRGQEAKARMASIAPFGNTQQPSKQMVQTNGGSRIMLLHLLTIFMLLCGSGALADAPLQPDPQIPLAASCTTPIEQVQRL